MGSVAKVVSALILFAGCGSTRAEPRPPAPCDVDGGCPVETAPRASPCPEDMVLVADRFCIDRYEASMVDAKSGQTFSPFYPPDLEEMRKAVNGQPWGLAAIGREQIRPPVPLLPEWQRAPEAVPRAVSRKGVVPQAYLSKPTAKAACEA